MTATQSQSNSTEPIDLGNGLIMRWSTAADIDNLAKLLSESFRWLGIGDPLPKDAIPPPNEFIKSATSLLMSGKSVAMSEYDYALVEDTQRGKGANPVVACVCLHHVKAYYGSVDVTFGKPELVATDPDYRNQGLVRKLMLQMIHPKSDARGHVLQVIPGISHFYRQFGYEYGLCTYTGFDIESSDVLPPLDKTKYSTEPYTLREATISDLPLLNRLSTPQARHANAVVGQYYTPEFWQYVVHDVHQINKSRFLGDRDTRIIVETATGREVGFTNTSTVFFGHRLQAMALEEDATYLDVAYPVLRQLFDIAKERRAKTIKNRPVLPPSHSSTETKEDKEATTTAETASEKTAAAPEPRLSMNLNLHEKHPLVVLLGRKAKQDPEEINPGFRLYTRIGSYPSFILKVAPELEARLAASALAGISGRLRLDFFRSVEGCAAKGLEVFIEKGKITQAQGWTNPGPEKLLEERMKWKAAGNEPKVYDAAFPPLVFTMLLTGRQSLKDLYLAYGDVDIWGHETRLLLNTLFPKGEHFLDLFCW
ncbi:hypothetical protein EMPS_10091 [Entomortierella parvispora]|uniref:N-acetyltransferase domain-containing protein n=1 Tax=Entomortierella parvispora TaxID=205924 RepID=A0A9P3HK52_9FUNG|nr:hypothetical protein EMPS_10091 [Entomortierella parvispora]